ncbi:MAG: Ig-like domain-containing protein [Clostridia bacterium]|nr:Ig-like domain-containing protein [Clostridia bacterium]
MKRLSLLLALCLLISALPAPALSEEGVEYIVLEEQPGEAVGDTGAEGLTAGEEEVPEDENGESIPEDEGGEDAPEAGEDAPNGGTGSEEAPIATGVDSARDASYSPAFVLGYVEVLEICDLTHEDGSVIYGAVPEKSVLLACDAFGEDALWVCFDTTDGALLGVMPRTKLRPLGDEESAAFIASEAAREGMRYYDTENLFPLPMLAADAGDGKSAGGENPDDAPKSENNAPEVAEEGLDNVGAIPDDGLTNDGTVPDGGSTDQGGDVPVGAPDPAQDDGAEPESPTAQTMEGGDAAPAETAGSDEISPSDETSGSAESVTEPAEQEEAGESEAVRESAATPTEPVVTATPAPVQTTAAPTEPVVTATPAPVQTAAATAEPPKTATPAPVQTTPAIDDAADDGQPRAVLAASAGDGAPAVMAPLPPHTDPNGPQLAANEITLGQEETFALNGAMPAGNPATIAYSSDNAAVAAVSPEGMVTGIAVGSARIKATASDGTYAECLVTVKKKPDAVRFNVAKLTIGKGEISNALSVILGSAPGECAGKLTFSTSKKKIVTVDANGIIRGVKTGKAVIKVKTYNGLTASCTVTVKKAPGKVTASADKKTLGVGETGQLTGKLPKKTAGSITYLSEQPGIVSVDAATGAMKAVAPGQTRVYAQSFNGKKGYVTVTVQPAPTSIAFPSAQLVMGVGMKLDAVATLNAGAAGTISYSVAGNVATVENGKLKATAVGSGTLTATAYNGLTASCALVVKPAPTAVTLPAKTITIGVNESVQLHPSVGDSASTFTYSSSAKKKVKVSADGVVKGVKTGSATITVKTYNKKKFKLKVVVQKAPGSVSVSPTSGELCVGEKLQLSAKLPKKTAGAVTYSSANEAVAKVNAQTGEVVAVGAGKTDIIARSYNGREARCAVTVFTVPTSVSVDVGMIELAVGQTCAIKATLGPAGSRSPLTWSSANSGVASVSGEGVIKGVGAGSTTVTVATNAPGVTAQVLVTVKPAPGSVALNYSKHTLNIHETCQLTPTIPAGTYTVYTYASSDTAVATVSPEGAVVAQGRGTAKLTVTTANGLSASMELTVLDPWYPDAAALVNPPATMKAGQTVQLQYTTQPAAAVPEFEWTSSNPSVASVSGDGKVTANGFGYALITAQSKKNSAIKLEVTLAVETDAVTLVIPARTTAISGISANLAKIDAIRASAIKQIDALKSGGVISSADADKRRSIVNNAFADYAFPWMTPALQKYWKAANSENGAKDFKPGIVYYGMPYISGSGKNRQYNAAKAVSESRFTNSGMGYYVLNQGKLLSGRYCGNDCSCFVDAAIWGTGSSHSADRTTDIASSSAYKTISDTKSMRPGDLLCKSASHVVMFLYYANAEKTKIMLIENGGSEAGTNTVHCVVENLSAYTSRGYKVRRLKSLG